MKNFQKSIRKYAKKLIIYSFITSKKSGKSSWKNKKEKKILIEDNDKISGSFGSKFWAQYSCLKTHKTLFFHEL